MSVVACWSDFVVHDEEMDDPAIVRQQVTALSRWENEGGAQSWRPEGEVVAGAGLVDVHSLTDELSRLQVRVVALEGLTIALLAEASERQIDAARETVASRHFGPWSAQHPVTIAAATRMLDLIELASRGGHPSSAPDADDASVRSDA